MALLTPTSITEVSLGPPLRLVIANFTGGAGFNQWNTGFASNVIDVWAQTTGTPASQANTGVGVSGGGGTQISFITGEDSLAVTLFVLASK